MELQEHAHAHSHTEKQNVKKTLCSVAGATAVLVCHCATRPVSAELALRGEPVRIFIQSLELIAPWPW